MGFCVGMCSGQCRGNLLFCSGWGPNLLRLHINDPTSQLCGPVTSNRRKKNLNISTVGRGLPLSLLKLEAQRAKVPCLLLSQRLLPWEGSDAPIRVHGHGPAGLINGPHSCGLKHNLKGFAPAEKLGWEERNPEWKRIFNFLLITSFKSIISEQGR